MAKAKKSKPKKTIRTQNLASEVNPSTGEDRRAEAVTVAWMLTMLATTVADALSALMFAVLPALFAEAGQAEGMSPLVFPRLLLLIAAFTGAACVCLTPFVYRFRRTPPPPSISAFGMVISIVPVVALFWMSLQR